MKGFSTPLGSGSFLCWFPFRTAHRGRGLANSKQYWEMFGPHRPQRASRCNRSDAAVASSGIPAGGRGRVTTLATVAAPELLDRLWTIHLRHYRAKQECNGETIAEHHHASKMSFNALICAVWANPDWIARTIRHPGTCEGTDQLVYLLLTLNPEVGAGLWYQTKASFFRKVNRNHGCLVDAIGIFRDRAEIGRLEDWTPCEGEPLDHAHVLQALVRIDPSRALVRLCSMPENELMFTTNWWLPGLIHRAGEAACCELLAIHEAGPSKRRNLAIIFSGRDIYLSPSIVRCLVSALEERLAAVDNDPSWEPRGEGHLLRLLSSLRRLDLLNVIEEQRGTRFETLLVRRASYRSGRTSLDVDDVGDELKRILLAIGGNGISQMVI